MDDFEESVFGFIVFYCMCTILHNLLTRTSLKTHTPQKREAMALGPVLTMGKDTDSDSSALATNQHAVAIAQSIPDRTPGRMTCG